MIVGFTVGMASLAGLYTINATPIFEAATKVRFEDKQPNIPEFYRTLSTGGEVVTEIEVLQSETLARDATIQLGLQLRLTKPTGVSRSELFTGLRVDRDVSAEAYIMERGSDGRFALHTEERPERVLARVLPGEKLRMKGFTFTLSESSREYDEIRFVVQTPQEAAKRILSGLRVTRANPDANIAEVAYQDSDRQLVAEVPNVILARFITRRHDAQKTEARSTVVFLRQQIDTLARQLNTSEDKLRRFRERESVVNPEVEATSQVTRLISMQSERSMVEGERAALAKLLAEVRAAKKQVGQAEASPYRRLLAFPTLLRNPAATDMLKSLAVVEDQRSSLLARRTTGDPDVEALTGRVVEIENQIESLAATYAQGLGNQVTSLDSTLQGFGQQLAGVPRRELEFARLTREPQVLEEMYSLLQTRLKEAEIAQAVEDPSVQVVDVATVPRDPLRPNPAMNLAAGLFVGLLLGVAGAFTREYMDRSVHTRADVMLATGLPVIGFIPSIAGGGEPVALISKKRGTVSLPAGRENRPVLPPSKAPPRSFTFLPSNGESPPEEPLNGTPTPLPQAQRMAITSVGATIAEAYGNLRTNLMFARDGEPVRTVVFTSAQPGEGKTTSAVNLALSLAHRGATALLIDGDLRRGMIHSVFGSGRQPGVSEVLLGKTTFDDALRYVKVDHGQVLHYLTTGALPDNPAAMMESDRLRELLHHVRGRYDTVIIDSPPATVITDAALLGSQVDGVVIVARAGVTHAAALACVMEQLGRVRAQVLGVILNDIDFKRDAAYDPAYQYQQYAQYSTQTRD